MMMEEESAFPRVVSDYCESTHEFYNVHSEGGMSLRDYFAAKALPISVKHYEDGHVDGWLGIAIHAYVLADAMLEARKK